MGFLNDLEKVTPKQEQSTTQEQSQKTTDSITLKDMQDFFAGMKEQMLNEIRKEFSTVNQSDNRQDSEHTETNTETNTEKE